MCQMALQQRRDVTRAQTMSKYSKPGLINFVIRLLLRTSYATLDYSHILLPLGIFFFKFLEWWYSENKLAPQSRPVPRPPRAAPVRPSAHPFIHSDRCSLCGFANSALRVALLCRLIVPSVRCVATLESIQPCCPRQATLSATLVSTTTSSSTAVVP